MPHDHLPRCRFAHLPTPLEPMARLAAELGGPKLWIKRDDCTGLASGGNKTRKLEFLVADALETGADTLITAGGVQSNHARQTAAAAARFGLACHLVLPRSVPWSDPCYEVTGNLLFDRLLGAHVHLLPQGADRDAEMARLAEDLAGQGRRAYVIPVGGSNPLGAIGYVDATHELLAQAEAAGFEPTALLHASGSGGTQAGLATGLNEAGSEARLIGISDGDPADELMAEIERIAAGAAELVGLRTPLDWSRVELLDDYIGEGYGLPTPAMVEAVSMAARFEAILLDPVYTGKAMAGLIDLVRRGEFAADANVVFVHTGGAAALHAYPSAFDGLNTSAG